MPPSSMIVYIYLIEPPKIYELIASVKTKADNYLINVFLYKFCISPETKILYLTKVEMLKSQLQTKNKVLLYKNLTFHRAFKFSHYICICSHVLYPTM